MIINFDEIDRKIMHLRALCYDQESIAEKLKMSQSAVSQRIHKIRSQTKNVKDIDGLFWRILLGDGTMHLLKRALQK